MEVTENKKSAKSTKDLSRVARRRSTVVGSHTTGLGVYETESQRSRRLMRKALSEKCEMEREYAQMRHIVADLRSRVCEVRLRRATYPRHSVLIKESISLKKISFT